MSLYKWFRDYLCCFKWSRWTIYAHIGDGNIMTAIQGKYHPLPAELLLYKRWILMYFFWTSIASYIQHVTWVQVTAGLGFFSVFSSFSQVISSEDSDSPAVYGDLFPSSGVPSGIVL